MPLKITREIPLWGILSVLGVGFLTGVAMYFELRSVTKELVETKTTLVQLNNSVNLYQQQLADVRTRMEVIQAQMNDQSRRLTEIEQYTIRRSGR